MSWFNSARRNGLSPESLIDCVQLHDFYHSDLDKSSNTPPPHRPNLNLRNAMPRLGDESEGYDFLSVPSISDLLNPTTSDNLTASTTLSDATTINRLIPDVADIFFASDGDSDTGDDSEGNQSSASISSENSCSGPDKRRKRARTQHSLVSGCPVRRGHNAVWAISTYVDLCSPQLLKRYTPSGVSKNTTDRRKKVSLRRHSAAEDDEDDWDPSTYCAM